MIILLFILITLIINIILTYKIKKINDKINHNLDELYNFCNNSIFTLEQKLDFLYNFMYNAFDEGSVDNE